MRITCSATIDNPHEREQFIKQITQLGIKPEVSNANVFIEYIGYNETRYEAVIKLFEEKHRHHINIRND